MFEPLRQFKIYVKLLKYFFVTQVVEFLEDIINNDKVLIILYRVKII